MALAEAAETDSHRQSDLLKANSTIEALRQQVGGARPGNLCFSVLVFSLFFCCNQVMRLNEEVIRKEEAVNSAQGTSALVEAKTQRRVETLERKLEDSTRRAHDLEWQLKEAKAEIKRYQVSSTVPGIGGESAIGVGKRGGTPQDQFFFTAVSNRL